MNSDIRLWAICVPSPQFVFLLIKGVKGFKQRSCWRCHNPVWGSHGRNLFRSVKPEVCPSAEFLSKLHRTSMWPLMKAWLSNYSLPNLGKDPWGPPPGWPLTRLPPYWPDTCLARLQPSVSFLQLPVESWWCLQLNLPEWKEKKDYSQADMSRTIISSNNI